MWIYIITWVTTIFAYKILNSFIIKILSGMLWVTSGIYRIAASSDWDYLVTGIILITIGIYMMIMVGIDLAKGE